MVNFELVYQHSLIWIRITEEDALSDLITRPILELAGIGQINIFDLYAYTCSAEMVTGGLHEQLASNFYLISGKENEALSVGDKLVPTWDQLPEETREFHRQKANRIQKILKSGGYRITPLQNWDACSYMFSADEVEIMAIQEHELLEQEMQTNRWRYRKKHLELMPWEELPEKEREKNRIEIRNLSFLIAQIGYQIDRISKA